MTTLILSVFFSISSSAYDVCVDGVCYNLISKGKIAEVTYRELYDYNNYPDNKYYRNYIFLKKDNKIMIVEFNTSFEISQQRIDVLKALIDTNVFDN